MRKRWNMKMLEVLGTGCPKCNKLASAVEAAAREAGVPYELRKVTEIKEIMAYGVSATPALLVDGEIKCMGNIPPKEELMGFFK